MNDITLREIAVDDGVPVGTIEKDLALVSALHTLSKSPLKQHLIFKGGTAIKMAYIPEARFSEDLDFTVQPPNMADAIKTLHQTLSNVQINSINFHDARATVMRRPGSRNYGRRERRVNVEINY